MNTMQRTRHYAACLRSALGRRAPAAAPLVAPLRNSPVVHVDSRAELASRTNTTVTNRSMTGVADSCRTCEASLRHQHYT